MNDSEISTDYGDIKINGEFFGQNNIETDYGYVTINLVDTSNRYNNWNKCNYDFSTKTGSIYINGVKSGNNEDGMSAKILAFIEERKDNLKIKTGMGDIVITHK